MICPLYRGFDVKEMPSTAHRGLWFDRFFDRYGPDYKIPDQGKSEWIKTVTGKCGDAGNITRAAEALRQLTSNLNGEARDFVTDWHLTTGLGNPHPVANGFAWHATLGVPYLPGAAVKGLVRAFIEGGWHKDYPDNKKAERSELLWRWFGSESKEPKECKAHETQAGCLIFFDALPTAPPTLAIDVMTPHMGKWYEKGDDIQDVSAQSDRVPADWHSPVPIPFLVVAKGTRFQFAIAPRRPESEYAKDVSTAMQALADALQWLGAGAKTAVGYGYMQSAANKQSAGLASATGRATWANANITWDKSRRVLAATAQGQRAEMDHSEARRHLDQLPEQQRRLLEKGKSITTEAEVEKVGNGYRLLRLLTTGDKTM